MVAGRNGRVSAVEDAQDPRSGPELTAHFLEERIEEGAGAATRRLESHKGGKRIAQEGLQVASGQAKRRCHRNPRSASRHCHHPVSL
jgi:hypothetical protein